MIGVKYDICCKNKDKLFKLQKIPLSRSVGGGIAYYNYNNVCQSATFYGLGAALTM